MIATVLLGIAFMFATSCIAFASYFLMRKLSGESSEPRTHELGNSVVIRISALHGLLLALVFAQEMREFQELKFESAIETNAIADVYFDADRYGTADKVKIQDQLADYVRIVVKEEWSGLGNSGRLRQAAWDRWDAAYSSILNLAPTTDRQRLLRDHMIAQIHTISENRVKRENHGASSISGMFWFAAIAGEIFVAFAYYTYPPTRANLVLLCLFGAFTGLILFFIYAFSNPLSEPGALKPASFQRLLDQINQARLASGH